jgi:hypothetical protein
LLFSAGNGLLTFIYHKGHPVSIIKWFSSSVCMLPTVGVNFPLMKVHDSRGIE